MDMGKVRVFVDTNVLVDFFSGRMHDGLAEAVMRIGQSGSYELCTSVLSAVNVVYLRKYYKDTFKPSVIATVVCLLPLGVEQWNEACCGPTVDTEDNVQLACAIDNGCRAIVSRDKHFKNSPLQIYTPVEFIKKVTL